MHRCIFERRQRGPNRRDKVDDTERGSTPFQDDDDVGSGVGGAGGVGSGVGAADAKARDGRGELLATDVDG